jgi:hypothetical protein
MARSVRQGVFETNSSTQHSLTFAFEVNKGDLKTLIGSDTIRFGVRTLREIDDANTKKKNYAVDCDNTFSWQDRADLFFWKLLGAANSPASILITLEKIREVFRKYGIEVEFLIAKNIEYLEEEFRDSGDGDSVDFNLTNYTDEDFEDQLINYIFSPYILEYSFSDDSIGGKEIDRLEKEFNEVLQEFPEGAVGFRDSDRS